ncbi:GNAT family N-acetyltransferase [Brachybacterium hainanense]|uniref:GNAT family N-acetyltransferase n=1 Tax=Brachybacterium hainanense TaxID=1541174 RepID=A0ABV6REX7_9MICO
MSPRRIREAGAADVPRIVEIVEAAYRGRGGWTTEEGLVRGDRTSADEVAAMLAEPAVLLLVAADETGRVLGCCYTRRAGERAEFGLFAVDPAAQAGGIGRALVEEQVRRLQEAGVVELELHVLQGRTELIAWYERRGFSPTGETAPFPLDTALLADPSTRFDVLVRDLRSH